MPCQKIIRLLALSLVACAAGNAQTPPVFDGQAALDATRRVVSFGPRRLGSAAHELVRQWLKTELRRLRCEVAEDAFTARTVLGPRPMTNLIAKFPGSSRRIVVLSGHYDTYDRPGLRFLGANDGGSSTGILLQLARSVARIAHRDTIWIVWLDGEESLVNWSGDDHTYGSAHLARRWRSDGTAGSILALINLDMIGDADLDLAYELNSTGWLRDLVWSVAWRLGYSTQFPRDRPNAIADDHVPFAESGIAALDLIDLDYGPDNAYWHTVNDTMDKLSARSFGIVGQVLLETLRVLEQRGNGG
jgi:glutaminyl-peptide cyclotransferase